MKAKISPVCPIQVQAFESVALEQQLFNIISPADLNEPIVSNKSSGGIAGRCCGPVKQEAMCYLCGSMCFSRAFVLFVLWDTH